MLDTKAMRPLEGLGIPSGLVQEALESLDAVLLDKAKVVRLAFAAFLAKGHVLVEDLPGVGKTTLALGIANIGHLDFVRIQMTPDTLPGDLLGASLFDPREGGFRFHPGPIFHSVVLVDELNRASPRTQSALLEAMAEQQVSADGNTYPLPHLFFVVATQNPLEESGVYSLPTSQLDRFMVRLKIGYPSREAEKRLLLGEQNKELPHVLVQSQLLRLQEAVAAVFLSPEIVDMIADFAQRSREFPALRLGLSPRGALALKSMAQAHAFLQGRNFVVPEDLFAVGRAVVAHRIVPKDPATEPEAMCRVLMQKIWGVMA